MSKRHNYQDFQVELIPNTAENPLDLDVGAAMSPSVTVLSKRNGRNAGVGASYSPSSSSSSSSGAGRRTQRAVVPDSGSASHQSFQQYTTDSRAVAEAAATVAGAQAAVAGAVPSLGLRDRPQGGAGVQESMQNVLGQIRNMQAAMKAQHDAFQSTLATYASRIESDFQTLVADIDASSAPSNIDYNINTKSNSSSGSGSSSGSTVEPTPLSVPYGFGEMPAPPPQPPTEEGFEDRSSRPRSRPTMRQTSSKSFSVHGDVEAALHSAPYARTNSGASVAENSAAEQSIVYIVAKVFL